MVAEKLVALIHKIQALKCETQTIELKAARQGCPTKLFDTLSSFSNQDSGGILVFGIDEAHDYSIVGVYDPQDLQKRVTEQCKQMEPIVRPLFTVAEINGAVVVAAEIPGVEVTERPVFYKGVGRLRGSYVRVGDADEPMTEYEIYSYDAFRRRVRDDIRISEFTELSQFNEVELQSYRDAVKKERPNIAKLSDEKIMSMMSIVKDGRPTLAGVLCFSEYPQAAFPQLCVTAVVVPGLRMGETGVDGERFVANQRIEGTIKDMVEEATLFVRRNMREKTIILDGKRCDKTEYPILAVREAILNALMHRDYSIHSEGSPVRLMMFNDRLEICNSGGLYGRLTIDSLGKTHADTRNQTLAGILEILKVAENRYSGIPTIRREMEAFGLPEPIFESRHGEFIVTLKNNLYDRPTEHRLTEQDGGLIAFCKTPRSRSELIEYLGKSSYYAMKTYVYPLIASGELAMTIPDKPKSRHQRYYSK